MKKFNIGDRVIFIEDGIIHKGTIQNIYSTTPNTAIIRLVDGNITKAYVNIIALDTSTETEPPLTKEGRKLINKADFVKTLYKVASPDGMLGDRFTEVDPEDFLDKSILVLMVGLDLVNQLFKFKSEIETTQAQLSEAIANCTTPEALDKHIEADDFSRMTKLCNIVLNRLIKELFEATND